MKAKVCGMLHPRNIAEVAELRPDFMGFIFYEKSPRCALRLAPEAVRSLPARVCRVGVFVDAPAGEVLAIANRYRLDMVQLHGCEPPETCSLLAETCRVAKAVAVASVADVTAAVERYGQSVDYFLFDAKSPLHGGAGLQFDWLTLDSYRAETPFFLSGGIGPRDADRLRSLQYASLHAIDVNSRFETEPGLKDARLLERFFEEIRSF